MTTISQKGNTSSSKIGFKIKKPKNFKKLRKTVGWLFILFVLGNSLGSSQFGTPCAINIFGIPIMCPLGYLQMVFASREFMAKPLPAVGLGILLIVVLGRFFCAWLCPSVLLNFGFKKKNLSRSNGIKKNALNDTLKEKTIQLSKYSNYAILVGSLVSAYIFGFPVFCIFCPVGLATGLIFAVSRAFIIKQPGMELILFPLILYLEYIFLKKSKIKNCKTICPLGALLGIFGSINKRFLRPKRKDNLCMNSDGIDCQACVDICTEGVDLKSPESTNSFLASCTNCLDCYGSCPAGAVEYQFLGISKKVESWFRKEEVEGIVDAD